MSKVMRVIVAAVTIFIISGSALAAQTTYQGFPVVNVVVDGKPLTSDVPAVNFFGRTVLPLRVIAEMAGADVQWDPVSNTATLTSQLTPARFTELQADKDRLAAELATAKKDTESAKAELNATKKDLATAQAEVKRLTAAAPVVVEPVPAPVVQPTLPPLKTVTEIQSYLQANLSSVTTPAGKLNLTFEVIGPYDDGRVETDYSVSIDWNNEYFFSLSLSALEHSLTAPPGGRAESINILKTHSQKVYEVMAKALPGKKIRGSFFRTWYDYPNIHSGFHAESHLSWQNYESASVPGKSNYANATVSQFHFTSDDK